MKPAKLRLIVAAVLFFGWLGWLGYLAFTASQPVVLSRPQFLVANLIVIADIEDLKSPVLVREIYWPAPQQALLPADKKLEIANLADCSDRGWAGPGPYILALMSDGKAYYLVPTPPSPGFRAGKAAAPRIYLLTPQTRSQLGQIEKP